MHHCLMVTTESSRLLHPKRRKSHRPPTASAPILVLTTGCPEAVTTTTCPARPPQSHALLSAKQRPLTCLITTVTAVTTISAHLAFLLFPRILEGVILLEPVIWMVFLLIRLVHAQLLVVNLSELWGGWVGWLKLSLIYWQWWYFDHRQ